MKTTVTTAVGEEKWNGSLWGVALRTSLVLIVLCGIAYPLVSTGLAQLIFPSQASGSMLKDSTGKVVGSELIGQSFTDPSFFQGRVSSIDYKAEGSGSNNYAPSNPELLKRVQGSIADWQKNNPDVPVSELPVDLITNSGSGLDPHITPESAKAQVPRISKLRGVSADELDRLVERNTEGRDLGVFGEKRVNVLKLNLALSELGKS
ncbi:potassium-transporting ATPase subunit KdpC [Paenibacillus sp. Y412MC10]|uniref:potassium-transporting ATPase subunit KdpC n=1 Tax=Geobacillus sp. (strain Y412MC10) TaxID=481743 RepID=UPI0011A0FF42|nr:potassium-transporting ATPase subunit KdpC [Paenibacillus sp. Y412MC10]